MGVQEPMLLALLLFSLCSPSSFSSVSNNLVSGNTDDNVRGKRMDESEYMNAVRGGGGAGGQAGGDGGQSNSSSQGGGNGVVPVYAAGAGGQRRNHKGSAAATCTPCWKGGLAVLIATSASLLLHIRI